MQNSTPLTMELELLKEELLKMGRLLEEQVFKSVKALVDKNMDLAGEVIKNDDIVDKMELEIEKKCLSLLALKQPLAKDLRLIGSVLRIIVDMERMSDLAEDVARIAMELYDQPYIKRLIDIPRMGVVAQQMVETAMKALIDEDIEMAMTLLPMECEMDGLYNQIFRELLSYMMQDAKNIPQATRLLLVAGCLERIGDHATNLGEMVIYVVDGRRIDINRQARSISRVIEEEKSGNETPEK
ncbi:MAG TPA: phosphate signaling complex protein PhoU [Syntrophomonadaceae bacterium]|nr:phosphate signaling complex protein PhoU [Syntrophomonadaceae bacterium]